MTTLKTRVIDPLREKNMLAQVHMDFLFSNIEDILELHREFLHHLATQQREKTVISRLHGEGNFLGKLAIYRDYAEAHDRQRKRLLELQKQPEFQEFLEQAWKKMERKDVDLYSYLSLPFYQVVQYPPILSKIIKNTPENHSDARHLNETIPAAALLANKCRETFLAVQNASRLQELGEQVVGFDVVKPGREFIREGAVEIIDARSHKRYAFLFNDVLLLARPKGRQYKTIRAIPVRKALYQFGEDILQILFDFNQLARLRFPQTFRQMWYKSLRQLQAPGKRWPAEIRMSNKKAAAGSSGASVASELEELKRKQRKLLQLVDKYEQLSSLHLTAMAKNDSVVSELQKKVSRLEKSVAILGGETAVDFIALDAQKEQLLLENAALKQGLSSVERKVRDARSRSQSSDQDDEGEPRSSRTASVSSVVSSDASSVRAVGRVQATPSRMESTFDDFSVTNVRRNRDQTTLDDILTPEVVAEAVRSSRSSDSESSSFIEP